MSLYLKKSSGQIFGPVEDEALAQWAREGRIEPQDLISRDQLQWVAPSSVESLGLDWFIPADDGTPYGPVHAMALAELLSDGTLGLDDTIAHKTTHEIRRVCEVLLPAMARYTASLRATLGEEQSRAEKLAAAQALRDEEIIRLNRKLLEAEAVMQQRNAAALATVPSKDTAHGKAGDEAKTIDRMRTELKDLHQRCSQHEKEVLRLKQLLEIESEAARKRETEAGERIKKLQESEIELLKNVQNAREKAALADRKNGDSEGVRDYGSLVQSYDDLSKNYDLLMEQFTAKTGDLAAAYAANENQKKETEERIARIEETMRRERDEADKARQRLVKSEEAHLELVRSYRELNDRYIRYRQKMEGPAAAAEAAAEARPKVRLI
jgi:DNA repair exonuclease SbcCD ATPase subunit